MTLVKGGTFKMGNSFEEIFEDELPVHQVTLNDFYIGVYEVSQAEYEAVMGNNPSNFVNKLNPVESVTWFDAVNYCNKLSAKEGLTPCYIIGRNNRVTWDTKANGYRLLTESEWEYAARGGQYSRNYTYAGDNDINTVAWYKDNAGGTPHNCGLKRPNELGIYDMSGNVWEWCWDWYCSEYPSKPVVNPTGVPSSSERCRRGGAWNIVSKSCRNTNRLNTPPDRKFNYVGFRIARNAGISTTNTAKANKRIAGKAVAQK